MPQRVALAGQREHGVGADQNLAVDARGDMHAEERVARVGHRVDQTVDKVAPFGFERVVLAAERHDHRVGLVARQFGEPVALQAAADHDPVEAASVEPPALRAVTTTSVLDGRMPTTSWPSSIFAPPAAASAASARVTSAKFDDRGGG